MPTASNYCFFDIDTQIDFLFPAGALYAKGAEQIIPAIAALSHLNHLRPTPKLPASSHEG